MSRDRERIGAILGTDPNYEKTVLFFGYGTYEGDEIPPETIAGFNMGLPNPKLKLDSGKVVWGCESWWGPETRIKAELEKYRQSGFTIVEVDVDEVRARFAGTAN